MSEYLTAAVIAANVLNIALLLRWNYMDTNRTPLYYEAQRAGGKK
jgi:hypothetical protein